MQANPEAGDVMPRTGGFRKLRWQTLAVARESVVGCLARQDLT